MSKQIAIETVALPHHARNLMRIGPCSEEQRLFFNDHHVGKLNVEYKPQAFEDFQAFVHDDFNIAEWAAAFGEFNTPHHDN